MTCSMADGSAPVVVTRLATQVEMIVNALLMMMCKGSVRLDDVLHEECAPVVVIHSSRNDDDV